MRFALGLGLTIGLFMASVAARGQQINFDYSLPAQQLEIGLAPLSSLPSADISDLIEEALSQCDKQIAIKEFEDNAHRNACRAFFSQLVPQFRERAEEFASRQGWRREGKGSIFQNRVLQIVYVDRGEASLRFIIGTRDNSSPLLKSALIDYTRSIAPDFANRLLVTDEIFPELMVRYDGKDANSAHFVLVFQSLGKEVEQALRVLAVQR